MSKARLSIILSKAMMHSMIVALSLLILPAFSQSAEDLYKKAENFRTTNRDSCLWYLNKVLDNHSDEVSDSLFTKALFLKGFSMMGQGQHQKAIKLFKEVLMQPIIVQIPYVKSRVLGSIGHAYNTINMYDSAMVYVLLYDQYSSEQYGEQYFEGKLQLGEVYRGMGRLKESNELMREAIRRAHLSENSTGQMFTLYYLLDNNPDSILTEPFAKYLTRYMQLIEKSGVGKRSEKSHDFLLINKSVEDKVELYKHLRDISTLAEGWLSHIQYTRELGEVYLEVPDTRNAKETAFDGLQKLKINENAGYQLDFLRILQRAYEKEEQFDSAYYYGLAYSNLADSIQDAVASKNLDALKVQFQTAVKEEKIASQQLELQKQISQRNMILAFGAVMAWVATFLVFWFWNKHRITQKLASQQQALSNERIEHLENERKILVMDSMMEGQEAERTRIAKDLHDGLGGLLANVKAHVAVVQDSIDEIKSVNVYNKVNQLIDRASQEVRRISHNMAPRALQNDGLRAAIEDFATQIRLAHSLEVVTEFVDWKDNQDDKTKIMIYRTVQELCTNVVKHSKASRLFIQLMQAPDGMSILIEDDGIGMKDSVEDADNGLGIASVRSRVEYLGGTLHIQSEPDVGVIVSIQIPVF